MTFKTSRFRFLDLSCRACGLLLALALGAAALSAAERKKNVMIIMVDDLRPQLAGYGPIPLLHGEGLMRTPAMDALAAEGTTFERAYCAVPICGASRLSLFTGSRPYKEPGENWGRHWTYTSRLDVEDRGTPAGVNNPGVTLPQHFRAHGYKMYSIDKVYHNPADDKAVWHKLVKEQHPWRDVPAYTIGDGERNHDEAFLDGQIASEVIRDLESLKDEAFFYGVGFPRPHLPFEAPKMYWDLYPEESIKLPPNYAAPKEAPRRSIHNWGELRNYTGLQFEDDSKERLDPDYARTLIRGYYATVSYVDAQIRRIVHTLKTTYDSEGVTLYDKTIIVLWGDHGYNLGEHSLWAKHALYNTSTQVPLVIRDPDLEQGNRVQALVESVDLYPTLCDLAGLGRPAPTVDNDGRLFDLHGSSLLPLLKDPQAHWKPAAYTRYVLGDSVRTDRYAYTEFINVEDEVMEVMLYDLKLDPQENYNIAAYNPELRERLSELLGKGPVGKRNAWRALVDESRDNDPLDQPLDLPQPRYPQDYFEVLGQYQKGAVW